MVDTANPNKIFTQKSEIMDYIGTTREYVVDAMVQLGLPVVFVNGRWWSSSQAVDQWLFEFFLTHRGQHIDAKPGMMPHNIEEMLKEAKGDV